MSLITSRMAKILMDFEERLKKSSTGGSREIENSRDERLKKSSTGGSREIENFRDLSSRIDFLDIDK